MFRRFIERPILSSVISIIIVILGVLGLITLPIEQYPDIAPPTIRVSASYTGASAETVLKSVVIPLEEQINGVENMTYMSSTASNNGFASIEVFFKQGTNADMAAVNVQNRVARANSLLPAEVTRAGVITAKRQNSMLMVFTLFSENGEFDETFLQNYSKINLLPQIQRVRGVGEAMVFGAKDYAMRIWLKPDVMSTYGLIPSDVITALNEQNLEAAPGRLGELNGQTFEYIIKYKGKLSQPAEFENIVIKADKDGNILRLKDVARVEMGALNYSIGTSAMDRPGITMAVFQSPGSNAREVIIEAKKVLDENSKMFPTGVKYKILVDANEFLDSSISKVLTTLFEAFILVFIVVFLFLQNFRATLIPAIAVPVAIIGTFFFLLLFGFSINLLTLFALVLAIGIVVDDAIVVVEAVHAKMDAGMTDAKEAAIAAMTEIAPAIISITLVMAAVFVPVSFIGGTSGVFFKQFGLTLAIAILISAVNALTLSPALCALFLKTEHNPDVHDKSFIRRFYYYFNVGFAAITAKYKKTLEFLGKKKHRWITVSIIVAFTAILVVLMGMVPSGFVPNEDSGNVMGMISLAPGSSLERTTQVSREVTEIAQSIPHAHNTINLTGLSFLAGSGSSYASMIMKMDPWDERDILTSDVAAMLKQRTDTIKDATFMFFGTPTLQGFGMSSGVELKMQDKTGGDVNKFYGVTTDFLDKLRKRPEVMMVMNSFDPRFPQKQIQANIAKIKDAGLTLNEVMGTLQTFVGSMYVSNFNSYGKQYRVVVQAAPQYRAKLDDLSGLMVKTSNGVMAPITEFITVTDVTGPQALTRFNLFSSMDVTVIPNYMKGYTSGDVLKALKEIKLPEGYGYDFGGMTREEANSSNQTILIFGLCIIFVYLLLAALYESYILPFAVLLSLPIGLAGVFVFVFVSLMSGSGIVNNIYVQISLIMLIGLLAKNAILIVEYALQRRHQGMSIVKAAVEGATARLRPILMTSLAFIFGLLPLALATGAGAVGNKSIGISAIGGMLFGTVFGILVIPSLFI